MSVELDSPGILPLKKPLWPALWRGFACRCPNCGAKTLFRRYLKVADRCDNCAEDFHHHRADDAPPYFTILITGHVIAPAFMIAERGWAWPTWLHLTIWLPAIVIMSLVLLPRVKGVIVALQWALNMHGFSGVAEDDPDRFAPEHRPEAGR